MPSTWLREVEFVSSWWGWDENSKLIICMSSILSRVLYFHEYTYFITFEVFTIIFSFYQYWQISPVIVLSERWGIGVEYNLEFTE
jgi:hypothetical protein